MTILETWRRRYGSQPFVEKSGMKGDEKLDYRETKQEPTPFPFSFCEW